MSYFDDFLIFCDWPLTLALLTHKVQLASDPLRECVNTRLEPLSPGRLLSEGTDRSVDI